MTIGEEPTADECVTAADVLNWLRMKVADEPGERDDVERVSEILNRVMSQ